MDGAAKQQDGSETPDRGGCEGEASRGVRATVAHALRAWSAPLVWWGRKYQTGLRRWGGLGGLAVGVGLMAGGLEPIGFSLILLGTAVLLVELDQAAQGTPDEKRK